jgi:pimeloyl-ACP methyl ester carboxylesterase
MSQVQTSAGAVDYDDTGGHGPVLVFLHGLLMDGTVWRNVVPGLVDRYRCVLLTLPLGGHRQPMHPDADLSLLGLGRLVGEILERLDLRDVTLIQNDWGGAQVLLAEGDTTRVARLVLTSSEAYDNYPPRPVRPLVPLFRIPGGPWLVMQALRLRALRRAPGGWGWMSKRPVPPEVMDRWFAPARQDKAIRRDLAKYVTSAPPRGVLLDWAARAATFAGPVLVVWATEDRMMPLAHARRLAEILPQARLVEIADSYTLLPEDQPQQLTAAIRAFLNDTKGAHRGPQGH